MAISCNNVVECEDGVDERDCDGNKTVLYVGLGIGFVMSLVASGIATLIIRYRENKARSSLPMPGSEEHKLMKILANQSKYITEREQENLEEFGPDMRLIDTNPAEAYNKAKVCLKL